MTSPLASHDVARLVGLQHELAALGRTDDVALLQRVAKWAAAAIARADESSTERQRRLTRERQQRLRDRRSGDPRNAERDAHNAKRDAEHNAERDAHNAERDDRNANRDDSAFSSRSALRMGGLGGAVVVGSSLVEATENYGTTPTNTARERNAERDAVLALERNAERDAVRSVTLVRDTRSRPVASTMLAALPATHEKLDVLQQRTTSATTLRRAAAELVYRYWAAKLGKANALLSADRERRIVDRLRENDDNASELCWAIDGLTRSAFHLGRNENGVRHDDITVVCRDRAQVEKFASACPQWAAREDHPFVRDARAELLASTTASPMPLFAAEVKHA